MALRLKSPQANSLSKQRLIYFFCLLLLVLNQIRYFLSSATSSELDVALLSGPQDGEFAPASKVGNINGNGSGNATRIDLVDINRWWSPHVDDLVRVFPIWHQGNYSQNDWCVESIQEFSNPRKVRGKSVVGLVFTKSPKTASSTGVGVSLQMAENVARRKLYSNPCASNTSHGFAYYKGAAFRTSPSFLWTAVRTPHLREVSAFFHFLVQRRGIEADATNLITYFTDEKHQRRNGQIYYINTHKQRQQSKRLQTRESALEFIKDYVIYPYDFIAITERMPESLVVLKFLLGLEHRDILVLNAKVSGTYLPWKGSCNKLPRSHIPPEANRYFKSNYTVDNYDYLLYDVVNKSLDRTIDNVIGREIFEQELNLHQKLQLLVQAECQHKAIFPCSSTGILQESQAEEDCFVEDSGCGHSCVQEAMDRYERGELKLLDD